MIKIVILTVGILFAKPGAMPRKVLLFDSGAKINVEVASTPEQKALGLMNRNTLPDGEGMLFVFLPPQQLSFWMKNTLIPLSIGFFDLNKKLLEVKDMEPVLGPVNDENLPRYTCLQPAAYALEVPKGWFAKKKIKLGSRFR